jgi:hypothetical protein
MIKISGSKLRRHLDELSRESRDQATSHQSDSAKKLQRKNVGGSHVSFVQYLILNLDFKEIQFN